MEPGGLLLMHPGGTKLQNAHVQVSEVVSLMVVNFQRCPTGNLLRLLSVCVALNVNLNRIIFTSIIINVLLYQLLNCFIHFSLTYY